MLDGGYVDMKWWCKEGSNFVKKMVLTAPRFWLRSENDDVNSTEERASLDTVRLNSGYVKAQATQKSCLVLIVSAVKSGFWNLETFQFTLLDLSFLGSPRPSI